MIGFSYILLRTKINIWDIFSRSSFKSEAPPKFLLSPTIYFLFGWLIYLILILALFLFSNLPYLLIAIAAFITLYLPYPLGAKFAIKKYRKILFESADIYKDNDEIFEFIKNSLYKSDKELFEELSGRNTDFFINRKF